MKIRTGFVSNSSSASFVLSAPINKNAFCDMIFSEAFWSMFSKEEIKNKLGDDIATRKGWIKQNEEEKDDHPKEIRDLWIQQSQDFIDSAEKILNNLGNFDNRQLVETVLRYNGLELHEVDGHTEVKGWTSMWNGPEDMGKTMMMIIACLTVLKQEFSFDYENDY